GGRELQLADVAALDRDREVEPRVPPGTIHPASVDARHALLASRVAERDGRHDAAPEVGAHRHGLLDGFASHGLTWQGQYTAHLCSWQGVGSFAGPDAARSPGRNLRCSLRMTAEGGGSPAPAPPGGGAP